MDGERFELLGELGRGGAGKVYRVLDRQRDCVVALKALRSPSPRDLYRFKREFRSVAELRHPNLVALYELLEVDGEWMFTMEVIDGAPFHVGVRPHATDPLDGARVADAIAQLADALLALHATGAIHRDLKPSNVLREPGGRIVLLDFGLTAEPGAVDQTHDRMAVGTPAYMSPEQARDGALTPASDWYSVGAMLYEVLTGKRPFEGTNREILAAKQHRDPLPPGSLADGIPVELEDLCLRLLARDPAERPGGEAVLAALGRTPSEHTRAVIARAAGRPVTGREAELGALRQALADSRSHAVAVVLRGAAGSGKTALLHALAVEARAGGVLVLEARATVREVLPFRAFDQLVDLLTTHLLGLPRAEVDAMLPADITLLGAVFPAARRLPQAEGPRFATASLGVDELRFRAVAAVLELVRGVARRVPMLILVDDGHHATEAGSRVITDHMRGPDVIPVCMVIGHDDSESQLLQNLSRWTGDLRVIDLGGSLRPP